MIGNINAQIRFNEGSGNNQALGGLVFVAGEDIVVNYIACYILQTGSGTGNFQMAVLQPVSNTQAQVVAITDIVTTITPGLFELPLTAAIKLGQKGIYYFAVYNQVNGSIIGGSNAGIQTTIEAPPINFRVQNISGFTLGTLLNTSDVNLALTPWVVVHE